MSVRRAALAASLSALVLAPAGARAELGFAACLAQGQFFGDRIPAYAGQPEAPEARFSVTRPDGSSEDMVRLCKTGADGKAYFAISYSATRGVPDWVAYRLEPAMTEDYVEGGVRHARTSYLDFRRDPELRALSVRQAIPYTYAVKETNADPGSKGEKFARGHLVPDQDMSGAIDANLTTYYFSNCAPQSGRLNSGKWLARENQARKQARESGKPVWVISGTLGVRTDAPVIGPYKRWQVAVPDRFFKVLAWKDGDKTIARAWVYPNDARHLDDSDPAVAIADLERLTGLGFRLPAD